MKLKETIEHTDFGTVWRYSDDESKFRFALYMYDDDPETIYMSNVYVDEAKRGKGIGQKLVDAAENIARKTGCRQMILKVLDESWMHEWYARCGYEDLMVDEEEDQYIWMRKDLQ